ncbi:hypothetical protein [Mycetocola spongiae]|uniref:hypothetical protein n=1 Tax=Mycetocola spongiae TaxID=2859226 RepID=UPI001CF24469|nr:hypothetical protein [Mycetocola spongiae]UCR89304.1 hypothetical protein KXZ72_00920 [Mycetocola spongiae]
MSEALTDTTTPNRRVPKRLALILGGVLILGAGTGTAVAAIGASTARAEAAEFALEVERAGTRHAEFLESVQHASGSLAESEDLRAQAQVVSEASEDGFLGAPERQDLASALVEFDERIGAAGMPLTELDFEPGTESDDSTRESVRRGSAELALQAEKMTAAMESHRELIDSHATARDTLAAAILATLATARENGERILAESPSAPEEIRAALAGAIEDATTVEGDFAGVTHAYMDAARAALAAEADAAAARAAAAVAPAPPAANVTGGASVSPPQYGPGYGRSLGAERREAGIRRGQENRERYGR